MLGLESRMQVHETLARLGVYLDYPEEDLGKTT
jgi:hypothetical protein